MKEIETKLTAAEFAEWVNDLNLPNDQGHETRQSMIFEMARLARSYDFARLILENALCQIDDLIDEKSTFRGFFFDCDRSLSIEEICRQLCVNDTTLIQHIDDIVDKLLQVFFPNIERDFHTLTDECKDSTTDEN